MKNRILSLLITAFLLAAYCGFRIADFGLGQSSIPQSAIRNPQSDNPQLATDRQGSRKSRYAVSEDALYKSPVQIRVSKDGRRLFVTCENSGELLIVDTQRGEVIGGLKTGNQPFGVALSPDDKYAYVSNRGDNTVSVFDTASQQPLQVISVGDNPHDLAVDAGGANLYVANLDTGDISVIETAGLKEVKRLEAGRAPFGMALSSDGRFLYVSNQLSSPVPFRTAPAAELTVIDTARRMVVGRRQLAGAAIAQNLAVSPDNRFVIVALEIPKNLLPETQVHQGWMATHGFAIAEAGPEGRVAYLLLDEANLYYADPFGVAFSRDGSRLYISSSGVNTVSVLNADSIYRLLQAGEGKIGINDDTLRKYARNLGISAEYVQARIATENNPKGVAASPDGRWVYVANRLSDSIQVIDCEKQWITASIQLGGPKIETELRRGARMFNSADISFQRQLSCNTCHPENNLDGLAYDIVAPEDAVGRNIVDNRTMRGISETGPYKWNGHNPTIKRQDGPRAAQFFFRSHGFEPQDLDATVHFVESLGLRPNRYAPVDGSFNEFQRRGKLTFERAYTKDGRYIPIGNRCIGCHTPPYYTDHMIHDVGSQTATDDSGDFDTPQIGNIYDSAPYMHDGRCDSLEEIWTIYNPGDTHGVTNDMAKENLNDLIEYTKTLSVGDPISDKELVESFFARSAEGTYRLKVRDLDAVRTPEAHYVGNSVCASCHLKQFKNWLGTKHARTFVMLGMEKAVKVAANFESKPADPQSSAHCLKCHGTGADVAVEFLPPQFHIEEGVQCERCHGPGENHAAEEAIKLKQPSKSHPLTAPTEQLCLECHKKKPSHEVLGKKPWDYATAIQKIPCKSGDGGVK